MAKKITILQTILQTSKKALWIVALFSFFVNAFMLTLPIYMLQVFDRVLASQSGQTLLFLTLIALFIFVIMGLVNLFRSQVLIRLSRWFDHQLGPEAITRGPDQILRGNRYVMEALKDIQTIRQVLSGPSIITVFDSPWVPFYLIIISLLHPMLGIIATIGAILLFVIAVGNAYYTRDLLKDAEEWTTKSRYLAVQSLRNAESIQAMGMLSPLLNRWFTENERGLVQTVKASDRAAIFLSLTKFVRLSLQVLMLGGGAYLVIQNTLTPGMMIAATILLSRALSPVEQAIGAWNQIVQARQAYQRLTEYFKSSSERPLHTALPKVKGEIEVKDVSFLVPGRKKPILDKLNFVLPPGKTLVVIGASTAGKTTLARLLVGAYPPADGHIRLDGADIYKWDRAKFGEHVGYLPQAVELLPGTVKANIARLAEDIDEEKLLTASELAGAQKMILALPQGFDTDLSSPTQQLSGGQQQRIGLARAIYSTPQLLVLDEPNTHLDANGQKVLLELLLHYKKLGKTLIIISHQQSILKIADNLLWLDQGQMKLYGPRDEVLKKLQKFSDEQKK